MTEPKFTKGPWKITEEDWEAKGDTTVIYDNDGEEVLGIIGYIKIDDPDLQLIAAAPDMYEALEFQCKNCLGRYSISKDSNECALYIKKECMIAKALRKARGEAE
jgi:uncharacterized protein YxjI